MRTAAGCVDELENNWGVTYTQYVPTKAARKSQINFDTLIKKTVPGFQLYSVQAAGTHSNAVALQDASNYQLPR